MRVFKSMIAAFATFSRIPLPMVELDSEDCKYSMCFFPMVGFVIGLLEIAVYYLAHALGMGSLLRAALMTVLPLLVTGGIHMDGFCDTSDAFNSYQPKERKLEILKDPHIGAFGVIRMAIWLLVYFGLMTEVTNVLFLAATFVISRALTALTVVLLKTAKDKGMGASEKNMSEKNAVVSANIVWICIGAVFLIAGAALDISVGESALFAILTVFVTMAAAGLWTYRYKCIIYKQLGGFTGDTSGWHLTVSELLQAGCIVVLALFGRLM